ncbi:MAG: tetratricopeptide repeat protein, partial [Deltaproteobacteria bacterium]|nr:tetratricopeptide repeat protein [Deltaproteobacteria bacterium]
DGVNVAARIEGLAEPGGICISRGVCDHVKKKLKLGFEYLGEHAVKNISEPVRVYKVLTSPEEIGRIIEERKTIPKYRRKFVFAVSVMVILGIAVAILWNLYFRSPLTEVASVENMAFPLPDKPSIAVLPFDNMSKDPDQDYFSDGLTEEIITALSKVPKMFVIARNSTFTYKGKPVKVQQVAEDLGVRYVLEGSVRKDKDKVRITVQLIDALTGHHLWAERYDRDLKDIFAVQDEITMEILSALEVRLTDGEQALLWKKGTNNLQVYLKFLQGGYYARNMNPENNFKARHIFEDVISQELNYASAVRYLAVTHHNDVWLGTTKSPKESLRKAAALARKSISIDASNGSAYGLLGHISILKKDWGKAIPLLYQAVELEPNGAISHMWLGLGLNFAGRPEEAIPILKKAIRLNPIAPAQYFNAMAIAYRMVGQYDKAIEYLEKGTQRYPNHLFSHLNLSACYILAGREQEAYAEAKEVLRLNHKFSIDQFAKTLPLKNQKEKKRFIGALRKAFSVQSDS